jgi:signal transduction histidine kinase
MRTVMLKRWWPRGLVLVAGFTLVGLFFASRTYILYNSYPDNSITWWDAMWPALVDWYGWALLSPLGIWLAWRIPIERERWLRGLAVHLAAGSAVAVAKVALDVWVGRPVLDLEPQAFDRALWMSFHPNLLTYAVIVGLVHAIVFYRRFREHEIQTSRLEARLAEARLEVLRMQLNPHFLFNTLHAIGTLMHRDVDAAERVLTRLSELLRMTIEQVGSHEVPLRVELDFLERYLEIEQIRFADRLIIELRVDPATLDLAVPYLVLQPLVENAIRHGIGPRAGPGRVAIVAARRDGWLEIAVRDDGRGLNPRVPEGTGAGVGLTNTRARLEQMYGERHRFEIRSQPAGGVEASLTIPARECIPGSVPEPAELQRL